MRAFPQDIRRNPSGCQPLKLGIDHDLVARLGGMVSRSALKRALGIYTSCLEYRATLIEGAARIDLDGNQAGAVTAGEAEHALATRPAKTEPTPSTPPTAPPQPKRLSLDDLRRAARERKGLA